MGWRSKLIFLMIVYFAGFATAIYYLAPSGAQAYSENYYTNNSTETPQNTGVLSRLCDKTFGKVSANFSGMNSAEFKEKFNLGLKKLLEMSRAGQTAGDSQK